MTTPQNFVIQTQHSLVNCAEYSRCCNLKLHTADWGKECKNCCRNKYASQENAAPLSDNFVDKASIDVLPTKSPAPKNADEKQSVKDRLVHEVLNKLYTLDESLLTPGCTVLIEANPHTLAVKIGFVDNLNQAQVHIAQALECLQKAASLYMVNKCRDCGKKIPVDKTWCTDCEKNTHCFMCGTLIPVGQTQCPSCKFDNTWVNIRQYDEP